MDDYSMNTGEVRSTADEVKKLANTYMSTIDDITSRVNGLSAYWGGDTYDTFVQTYKRDLEGLNELNNSLNDIVSALNDSADSGDQAHDAILKNVQM